MKDITNVEYFKNTLIFLKLEVKAGEKVLEISLENCKRTKMYERKVKNGKDAERFVVLLLPLWMPGATSAFIVPITCSRLRDSGVRLRVRWIEKAQTWKIYERKLGRAFSRPANFSRAFFFSVFPTIWEPGTGYCTYKSMKRFGRLLLRSGVVSLNGRRSWGLSNWKRVGV